MTPTLLETRATLLALLDVDPDGVDAVYDHEPDRETTGSCYVSIAFDSTTPTEQVWAVRVYSQTIDSIEDATTTHLRAIAAVDDLLASSAYGPSDIQSGMVDNLNALVARWLINVPRTTF